MVIKKVLLIASISLIVLSGAAIIYGFPQVRVTLRDVYEELTPQTLFSGEEASSRLIIGNQYLKLNGGWLKFNN